MSEVKPGEEGASDGGGNIDTAKLASHLTSELIKSLGGGDVEENAEPATEQPEVSVSVLVFRSKSPYQKNVFLALYY